MSHVGGEEGRDLGVVVGGIDLDHVAADDPEAGEAPYELLRLAARKASGVPVPGAYAGSTKSTSKET